MKSGTINLPFNFHSLNPRTLLAWSVTIQAISSQRVRQATEHVSILPDCLRIIVLVLLISLTLTNTSSPGDKYEQKKFIHTAIADRHYSTNNSF